MNQDQARRWAEEMGLPPFPFTYNAHCFDPDVDVVAAENVEAYVREAIAAALVKLTQQEPIVWGYRTKSGLFDCISNEEHARAPGDYDIPLYTHPAPSQQEDRKPLPEPDMVMFDPSIMSTVSGYSQEKVHAIEKQWAERVAELERALDVAREALSKYTSPGELGGRIPIESAAIATIDAARSKEGGGV